MRVRKIVLVLCMGVKRHSGKMRSKVHVRPKVLIHLKTSQNYMQYSQFILNSGVRWSVKLSNKKFHGREKKL